MPKLIEDARHRASAPSHDGEGASPRPTGPSRARCRARAKTLLTILAALVLAPLTVVVGMGIPGNGYYLSGTLIVLYAIVPFFVAFEGRRPTAREIAVVAVLTALAVAARAAFVWVPHFKPMAAIIMIAGIAAGPQTGFLVGSVAALASNFIFGQGPWTPWQMFSWGIVGFLTGTLYRTGIFGTVGQAATDEEGKRKKPILLCVAGFLFSVLYGWIMNLQYILGYVRPFSLQAVAAAYLSSAWFDISHGICTTLVLWVAAEPWVRKLSRIKRKFGLDGEEYVWGKK